MSLHGFGRIGSLGVDPAPMPLYPPDRQIIDPFRTVHEATRAAAVDYYRDVFTEWWTWRAGFLMGQKFGERELRQVRGDLVRFFHQLVVRGFARWGMLPMAVVAEISLDFCIVGVDQEHRPIRTPHTFGLDVGPLAQRLAAYWMGAL